MDLWTGSKITDDLRSNVRWEKSLNEKDCHNKQYWQLGLKALRIIDLSFNYSSKCTRFIGTIRANGSCIINENFPENKNHCR